MVRRIESDSRKEAAVTKVTETITKEAQAARARHPIRRRLLPRFATKAGRLEKRRDELAYQTRDLVDTFRSMYGSATVPDFFLQAHYQANNLDQSKLAKRILDILDPQVSVEDKAVNYAQRLTSHEPQTLEDRMVTALQTIGRTIITGQTLTIPLTAPLIKKGRETNLWLRDYITGIYALLNLNGPLYDEVEALGKQYSIDLPNISDLGIVVELTPTTLKRRSVPEGYLGLEHIILKASKREKTRTYTKS